MKLGIKIVFTSGGVQDGAKFNNDECLDHYASDVRPFLRKAFPTRDELKAQGLNPLTAFDESSKTILMVQMYGTQGTLLTVIKASPEQTGRTFDNTAAWVHLPYKIAITATETLRVVKELESIISAPYSIDENRLKALASQEYGEMEVNPAAITTKGANMGVVEYGADSHIQLKDLLGLSLLQPSYTYYHGVFFINKEENITISDARLRIKQLRLQPVIEIHPPKEMAGFVPYIGSKPFISDIEVLTGQKVNLIWRKPGFRDVTKVLDTTGGSVDMARCLPQAQDMVHGGESSEYIVSDASGDGTKKIHLSDTELQHIAQVLGISRTQLIEGFSLRSGKAADGAAKADGKQGKGTKHYEFYLPAYNEDGRELRDMVVATIDTMAHLGSSPIKGYVQEDGERLVPGQGKGGQNRMTYIGGNKMQKMLYLAIGLAVMGIIWACVAIFGNNGSESTVVDVDTTDSMIATPSDGGDTPSLQMSATEYLDGNRVWTRSEMESIPELAGLFDDLNNFQLEKIGRRWGSKVNGSVNLDEIISLAKDILNNGFNPASSDWNSPFKPASDGQIVVNEYISYLKNHAPRDTKDTPKENRKASVKEKKEHKIDGKKPKVIQKKQEKKEPTRIIPT